MSLTWRRSAQPWIHSHHRGSTNSAEATQGFAVTSGILQAMATTWISTFWHHKKQIHARNLFSMEMEASHFIKSAGYSHISPVDSSSWSLGLSMNLNKSFIWVLASLRLLGFPTPSVCLRPAGAMLGFASFLQESQRSSAHQTFTHWNHTDLPSCNWGSSSCTAQPASVRDLWNKNTELDNFLMNGHVLVC